MIIFEKDKKANIKTLCGYFKLLEINSKSKSRRIFSTYMYYDRGNELNQEPGMAYIDTQNKLENFEVT